MKHWNLGLPVRSASSRYVSPAHLRSDNHVEIGHAQFARGGCRGDTASIRQKTFLLSLFVKPVAQMVDGVRRLRLQVRLVFPEHDARSLPSSPLGVTVGAPRIFHAARAASGAPMLPLAAARVRPVRVRP